MGIKFMKKVHGLRRVRHSLSATAGSLGVVGILILVLFTGNLFATAERLPELLQSEESFIMELQAVGQDQSIELSNQRHQQALRQIQYQEDILADSVSSNEQKQNAMHSL